MCTHIFSFEEGAGYDAWLNYEPKLPKDLEYCGVVFNYCPLCGEALIIKEVLFDDTTSAKESRRVVEVLPTYF